MKRFIFLLAFLFFVFITPPQTSAQIINCNATAVSQGYSGGACYDPQPPINTSGCEGNDVYLGECSLIPPNKCCASSRCSANFGSQNPAGCYCNDKVGCLPGLYCDSALYGYPPPNTDTCRLLGSGSPPPPRFNIRGTVFIDNDRDGNNEGRYGGATVRLSGAATGTRTTDSSGNYAFLGYLGNNRRYTVTLSVPSGYQALSSSSVSTTLGPSRTINFRIARIYSISGNVFNDINKNRRQEGTESNYTGGITISASGGNLVTDSGNGTYAVSNLPAGTYTISYTSPLPRNWRMVYPLNGPPPSFSVRVGPSCSVDTTTGASCYNGGDVQNLKFAITNSIPWIQSYGLDVRFDNGYSSIIPLAPAYPPYASVKDDL